MTDTQPRFFEKENKLIAHLEWEAIRILCFDGSHMNIADAYPKFEQRRFYWTQKYYDNATDEYHSIKRKITDKEYQSLDEFYADLKPILKPKPRGNMLKDKKKRTSQKEFQRDAKGEGFIDNDTLLSAAAKAAFDLAEALAEEDVIVQTATQLAKETDDGIPLSDAQMSVLCDYIRQRVKKHQKLDKSGKPLKEKLLDSDSERDEYSEADDLNKLDDNFFDSDISRCGSDSDSSSVSSYSSDSSPRSSSVSVSSPSFFCSSR